MKKLISILILSTFLFSCSDGQIKQSSIGLTYNYDHFTDLCFAINGNLTTGGYVESIANVPCTEKVLKQIKKVK